MCLLMKLSVHLSEVLLRRVRLSEFEITRCIRFISNIVVLIQDQSVCDILSIFLIQFLSSYFDPWNFRFMIGFFGYVSNIISVWIGFYFIILPIFFFFYLSLSLIPECLYNIFYIYFFCFICTLVLFLHSLPSGRFTFRMIHMSYR